MTIAEVDKEVNDLIAKHSVYGAETIINALVRAMKSRDAFARVGAGAYGPPWCIYWLKLFAKKVRRGNV